MDDEQSKQPVCSCPHYTDCPAYREFAHIFRERDYQRDFLTKLTPDSQPQRYSFTCASCGKTHRKKWFRFDSEDKAFDKLYRRFQQCPVCGGWVCKECFLIYTDTEGQPPMCAKCAKEKGLHGWTNKQYRRVIKKLPPPPPEALERNWEQIRELRQKIQNEREAFYNGK